MQVESIKFCLIFTSKVQKQLDALSKKDRNGETILLALSGEWNYWGDIYRFALVYGYTPTVAQG